MSLVGVRAIVSVCSCISKSYFVIPSLSHDCQVTMEWWTHLWLNEGFATWIEYLCVDHTHPEFDIWTNFLSTEYAQAMSLDALANSHPIEVRLYSHVLDAGVINNHTEFFAGMI